MKQNHLAYLFFPTGYVFFSIFDNWLILTRKLDEINLLFYYYLATLSEGDKTWRSRCQNRLGFFIKHSYLISELNTVKRGENVQSLENTSALQIM